MGHEHFPVTFGEWLKVQRKALDLTQEELAQRVGCSIFALRKIESGERRPSKQLAALLASALQIPPDDRDIFLRVARGEIPVERLHLDFTRAPPAISSSKVPTLSPPPLPAPHTPLVGREPELAAIHRIFTQPHCRLITLTGPGGIGKTRLAAAYASGHQADFPGGVFFVPLSSIDTCSQMVPAVAEAVGFHFSGPGNLKEQLYRMLKEQLRQPALFVMDNVEHLIEPAATEPAELGAPGLVAEMLQKLPWIKILATSRERLNLRGEWTYEIHGLGVPPDEMIAIMEHYSAVELFIQRAQQIREDFELAPGKQHDILRICQYVDGIPLAIELAAAWVGVLSCEEIAREIETNFDLLTTTLRDVPRRHRSLRAAFDHSWKLLSEDECLVLQRLSVFRGGFTRDAAAQVAGASLPALASLVSKSLVRRLENGRYDLHEVIKQYANAYLRDQQERDNIQDRHCQYYLSLLRDSEKSLKSDRLLETRRTMNIEMENIRQAWAGAVERRYSTLLLGAVRALGRLYETSGLHQEGIDQFNLLIQSYIDCPGSHEVQRLIGEALAAQGLLYFRKGEFDRAQAGLEESTDLLRLKSHLPPVPDPFIYLGVIEHLTGNLDRSNSLLTEGLVNARTAGDRWFEAYAIFNLGYLASLKGQHEDGYAQMNEGMTIWRNLGDPFSIALGLNYLTPTMIKLGLYEAACDGLEDSIQICAASGNRWGAGTAYRMLGTVKIAMEDYPLAQSLLRKSLETFSGFTTGWDVCSSTLHLARSYLLTGDLKEARKAYLEGLNLAVQSGVTSLLLEAVLGLANVMAEEKEVTAALRCAYVIQNYPTTFREIQENAARMSSRLEGQIPRDQASMIKQEACVLSLETLVSNLFSEP